MLTCFTTMMFGCIKAVLLDGIDGILETTAGASRSPDADHESGPAAAAVLDTDRSVTTTTAGMEKKGKITQKISAGKKLKNLLTHKAARPSAGFTLWR